jgi:cyclic pyranopterin phosphate synthase
VDIGMERARYSAARALPVLIRPEPRQIHVSITANCNQRCVGCRYGRDFMPGQRLPYPVFESLIDDAAELGIWQIRLYGGEPLLHPDLARMVAHVRARGLDPYVTTNAVLLAERIDALYAAGLRQITVGYYGTGADYDAYVQRPGRFARVERGIAAVRDRYGMDVDMRINWLLMRPSCSVEALDAACAFAERYALKVQVDLVHYSLPYFTRGPSGACSSRPTTPRACARSWPSWCAARRRRRSGSTSRSRGCARSPTGSCSAPTCACRATATRCSGWAPTARCSSAT